MFASALIGEAVHLLEDLRRMKLKLATAESCTGGLIAGLLTEIPDSSDVLERGFVTYSNAAKIEMLGVPSTLLDTVGAVSREVAIAMAEGALAHSRADVAVAVTGLAGPRAVPTEKPVGLVHIAAVYGNLPTLHEEHHFTESTRSAIRLATVSAALTLVRKAIIMTY